MKTLTPKQQALYEICKLYKDKLKKDPTLKELAEHFKISESAIHQTLSRIKRKGYL